VIGASALVVAISMQFVTALKRRDVERRAEDLLGTVSVLLVAAWTYDLTVPALAPGSVSGRELVRVAAYGLVLVAAVRRRNRAQGAAIAETASAERRRLARDLHDGIAQDLAFISAYGERLAKDLGAEHPIVVAARRALAASRGVIADLTAVDAPSIQAALEAVASELATRHAVTITVSTEGLEPSAEDREELVRITREATVNAVEHGGAKQIDVLLQTSGDRLELRVEDDGCGIGAALSRPGRGCGIAAMGERAQMLGGRLSARPRAHGGSEVKVVV
jgi:signal transduction histidine kinase